MLAPAAQFVTPYAVKKQIRDIKKQWAIEENKRRLESPFYSLFNTVPTISPVASAIVTQEEPNYMGYPLSEYEDEVPFGCFEQYGEGY